MINSGANCAKVYHIALMVHIDVPTDFKFGHKGFISHVCYFMQAESDSDPG